MSTLPKIMDFPGIIVTARLFGTAVEAQTPPIVVASDKRPRCTSLSHVEISPKLGHFFFFFCYQETAPALLIAPHLPIKTMTWEQSEKPTFNANLENTELVIYEVGFLHVSQT